MTWEHMLGALLATIIAVSAPGSAPAKEGASTLFFDDSQIVSVEYPPWFKSSFMDLPDDLGDARDDGKMGLMLFFGTEGCGYCMAFFKHTLGNLDLQADVRSTFDVIALDMFGDIELTDFFGHQLPIKQFALREGATVSPTIVFYGLDGTRLLRTQGYYPPARFRVVLDYLVGGHFATQSLRVYAARRALQGSGPSAKMRGDSGAGKGPYDLDLRRTPVRRTLLVLFEGGDCPECQQLRSQVLTYPPVRKQLEQFETVRLDWMDTLNTMITPTGVRSSPADWAERLGIAQVPTILFFDDMGQEVLRLDSQVLRQRMERALLYVFEKAYLRGTTYQQFTRAKTLEKLNAEGYSTSPDG